jgi:hypothetical protein
VGVTEAHRILYALVPLVAFHQRQTMWACPAGMILSGNHELICKDGVSGRVSSINQPLAWAVLEQQPNDDPDEGLAYDKCSMGVVTDVG